MERSFYAELADLYKQRDAIKKNIEELEIKDIKIQNDLAKGIIQQDTTEEIACIEQDIKESKIMLVKNKEEIDRIEVLMSEIKKLKQEVFDRDQNG